MEYFFGSSKKFSDRLAALSPDALNLYKEALQNGARSYARGMLYEDILHDLVTGQSSEKKLAYNELSRTGFIDAVPKGVARKILAPTTDVVENLSNEGLILYIDGILAGARKRGELLEYETMENAGLTNGLNELREKGLVFSRTGAGPKLSYEELRAMGASRRRRSRKNQRNNRRKANRRSRKH